MSTTTNLGLFKHDNVSTNENSFDIEKALNENFDKIDEAQGRNNSRLQTLENDNTTNKQDIANIKTKNTEQDTKIQTNTTNIANIQKEQTTQNTNISKNTTDITAIKQEQNTQNTNIKALQDDNVVNKTDIANIKVKNEEQDTYIEELETENARLRKDLDALPSGQASGEYIHVEDSAESRFKSFKVCGNSKQETRQGYNLLDMRNAKGGTDAGITCTIKEDGSYSYVGTATSINVNVWILGGYYGTVTEEKTLFTLSAGSYYIKDVVLFSGTTSLSVNNYIATLTEDTPITGVRAASCTNGATYNEIKYPIVAKSNVAVEWEQYGATPSLEFPSEIEAVGDNKNLSKIDKISTINGGYINASCGVLGAIEAGETYTISFNCSTKHTGTNSIYLRVAVGSSYENQTNLNYSSGKRISKTFTAINSGELSLSASLGTDYTNVLYDIKLEKGTIPTPYSPYGQGSANVTICNENLLSDKNVSKYNIKANGNEVNGDDRICSDFIKANENENYYFYSFKVHLDFCGLAYYDKNKKFIGRVYGNSIEYLLGTTPLNTAYIRAFAQKVGVNIINFSSCEYMLTKDTKQTSYKTHKSKTFTVPVQQEMLKIGDYADTFIKKDGIWYERHFIKKLTLTGNEDWQINGNTFVVYNIGKNNNNYKGYSNYFKYQVDWDNNENRIFVYDTTLVMSQANFDFSDIDSLKALLKEKYENGTPLVVYYASKEKDLECTSEQKSVLDEIEKTAQSYKNTTNIYSTDELSPIFEVEYRKDLETLTGTADSVDWSNVQNKPDLVAITDEEIDNIINY